MADIARLGLAIDSSQVEKGTVTLHQLTGAAGQASAAANRLAGATQAEAAGHKAATAATQVHTAALHANNAAMRMGNHVRTNMIYQLNDVGVSLASGMSPLMVAIQQVPQMLQFGLKPALESITGLGKGLVTTFWPITAVLGAVAAGVAGLTYEINKTAETQVGFFDVVQAGWSLLAENIGNALSPVWSWFVDSLAWVWDQISPILKTMGNGIIRPFAFGVEAIGVLWQNLPPAIGDVMITTANVIIKGIEWSINGATRLLNDFLGKYNEGLVAMGQAPIPLAAGITIPQASNPYQGALGKLGQGLGDASMNANTTDYMGDMFGALSERAQEIARAKGEVEELGGAAEKTNEKVKELANEGFEALKGALSGIGSGLWGAIRKGGDILGNIMDMLMSKVDNLIGKLLDSSIDSLLFGNSNEAAGPLGGGILSSLMGMLPGFSNGGSGVVGGSGSYSPGAADNTLFIAKAQKGEPFAFGNAARSGGGGVVNVNLANSYTIGGTVSDKDVARMAEERDARTAQAVIEAVKQSLPGWQANIQVHGAA